MGVQGGGSAPGPGKAPVAIIQFAAGPVAFATPATAKQMDLLAVAIGQTAGNAAAAELAASVFHHAQHGTLSGQLASAFLDGFHALPKTNLAPAAFALAS